MAREPIQMTEQGLEKIKEELEYLKNVRRQEISQNMGQAIEDGDLRESAAYDEARLAQSENEVRIADLEEIVSRAVIVESGSNDKIMLGSSALLKNKDGEQETFHLVGTYEADIFENRISDESPLGKQLMGKKVGQKVKLAMGKNKLEYTVLEVS